MAHILNNLPNNIFVYFVWMVPYCAHQLLGPCFLNYKENQLKVDCCQLKSFLKLTILKIVQGVALKMSI